MARQRIDRHQTRDNQRELIGLIPAGGVGARIGSLPCSKEIYPIGFVQSGEWRPKAACHYLLEKMGIAGVKKAYIVLREGKWDIPSYLRDGKIVGMDLAYVIMDLPFGVPFTIDQAFPFVREATIVFGFPDIVFDADDAFVRLLDRLSRNSCDIVLGLFPADRPQKTDMVDVDPAGKVRNIVIKPRKTDLQLTWGIAVWTPAFTRFMHRHVKAGTSVASQQNELFIGDVIQASVDHDLRVEAMQVSDRPFIDIGTPDDLYRAAQKLMGNNER